jgi:predicted DNA-binding protein (MmcQ/YjbR family)
MYHSRMGPRAIRRRLLEFALGFPGAFEDHPWGEDVAKVNKKVFVFLGSEDYEPLGMSVKLHDSHEQALMAKGTEPTGYGLGRAGWVSVQFAESKLPLGVLKDWIDESYRMVAPKRLVAELDARPARR